MDEKTDLLAKEYVLLQNIIDGFDARMLTIKTWSVTTSLAGIGAAFSYHVTALLFISTASTILFWQLEARWKTFQLAHYARIMEIEDYFAGRTSEIVSLQMSTSWGVSWKSNLSSTHSRSAQMIHVAAPHVFIGLVGVILILLHYIAGISV